MHMEVLGDWAIRTWERFYQLARECYEAAGCPYGDSDECMLRWLHEEMVKVEAERKAEEERM